MAGPVAVTVSAAFAIVKAVAVDAALLLLPSATTVAVAV
jgi:hypothetical protein